LAGASGKIGRTSRRHPGQIAGATEARLASKTPAMNVVRAHRVVGISACSRQLARDFADVFAGEIGVVQRDRPVDKADWNIRPANGAGHQSREPG
jgi:hypothetical protein